MSTEDGGPAFPQNDLSNYNIGPSDVCNEGMSLRDWFAGQIAAQTVARSSAPTEEQLPEMFAKVARLSYQMADAMIAARKGGAS